MSPRLSIAIAAALLAGALLALLLARGWRRRRIARRFRRGLAGQAEARSLLERKGYELLAEELEAEGQLLVDGEPRSFMVRIDYLARRRGRLYGVEVKTGERAPDPLSIATRRQLREYQAVLGPEVDGLLLVDMEARELHELRFPEPRRRGGRALALLVGIALGAAAAVLLRELSLP